MAGETSRQPTIAGFEISTRATPGISASLLQKLNLLTLHNRHRHFDALFLINVFNGAKCCPSVLETVEIRVPTRHIRNFTMFASPSSHCPSARRVYAANAVYKHKGILRNSCLSVNNLN
jgi:hypothetical protein